MGKLTKFFNDTVEEMRNKVSWPTYAELQKSSILVLVGSVVFAVIVGAMDFVYDSTLEWFYNQF
ncbi:MULTISPECIES: preprotein translocase subunit SecE [Rufibacter]|uniref:Protein translocase subunit SecE n=1 Tax=Rufibacter quisquiliarum TaxID=1549639 RepID=A0A839GJL5_9BACT|nr:MULTISPECIES: preprotein translocase subunit SecE [Rufibacter]MBA9078820.1 preprotein translocase subunit SecE [Rufibacter quisquiliarum]